LRIGVGKVLNAAEGTILATADRLELSDATDPTKLAHILLTDLATGAENNYFLPPLADILVGQTQAQMLVAKTAPDPGAAPGTPTVGDLADTSQSLATAHWVQAVIDAVLASIPPPYVPDTGDIMASAAAVKAGWLKLVGTTFGNVGSGAAFADATAQNLFNLFWAINGNTWPIGGGRGATAAADWAALKTITLPDARDMALVGIGGANVNIATLFATKGAASISLTIPHMPSHTHPAGNGSMSFGTGGGSGVSTANPAGVSGPTGGDPAAVPPNSVPLPVSLVQPSMGIVYWIRL
jgi:hypothetical protein